MVRRMSPSEYFKSGETLEESSPNQIILQPNMIYMLLALGIVACVSIVAIVALGRGK